MEPVNNGGHSACQNRVLTQLRKYYPDAVNSVSSSTWQILEKFWNPDLADIDKLMEDRYSSYDPIPRLLSDMVRAILVSVKFKFTSYTRLSVGLKDNHLLTIISGFTVVDTPGVGTFYDFHKRLWLSDSRTVITLPSVHLNSTAVFDLARVTMPPTKSIAINRIVNNNIFFIFIYLL